MSIFPALDIVLIGSGGDDLAATFSPELADITIYVIDVAAGEKIRISSETIHMTEDAGKPGPTGC